MRLMELVATFNQGDIALIKSLLESENIDFLAHGEHFNLLRPCIQPVRFMVAEDQLNRARTAIGHLDLTISPFSLVEEPQREDI